ncbi:hypothetical protein [uncultured Brevibacillus sp.]|uniref:hypothetical protein n=1 Tax=uncultured Brevibacillus sp. TaxID=169970 RepID=UPI002598094E|nr:hypothetical protein [uncultured Brevibacillus sp.]
MKKLTARTRSSLTGGLQPGFGAGQRCIDPEMQLQRILAATTRSKLGATAYRRAAAKLWSWTTPYRPGNAAATDPRCETRSEQAAATPFLQTTMKSPSWRWPY